MKAKLRKLLYTYKYMIEENSFGEFVETIINEIQNEINKKDNTNR